MKSFLFFTLSALFLIGGYFLLSKCTVLDLKKDNLSYYKSLNSDELTFQLYENSSSPFNTSVIKSLDDSYYDLVELGKDSNYKIKISQIEHEKAMAKLKAFYVFLIQMNECKSDLDKKLLVVCSQKDNKLKSKKIISYMKNQIYQNAKIPYNNSKEYFYLNYKNIIDLNDKE